MLFWIIAALLTLGASLAVLIPIARPNAVATRPAEHDLEVYRDQLNELDRDAQRGMIGPAEAEEARAEIARRMLRLAEDGRAPSSKEGPVLRFVAAASVLSIAVVSWGLYAATGSPSLADQPLSARLEANPADDPIQTLIARAEGYLASNPQDGRGWDVLAPVYLRTGRAGESAQAYRNAIRLQGSSAKREAGLGEALTAAAGGLVTQEALTAFRAALAQDGKQVNARFYLATADAQEGRLEAAAAGWKSLLGDIADDSPWRQPVEASIAEVERRARADGGATTDAATADSQGAGADAGPQESDVAAAARMSPAERAAMIESMVAGLDERLRGNPHDPEGWIRLIRSYVVLERADDARLALERGLSALGPASEDGMRLAEAAKSLGLTATE